MSSKTNAFIIAATASGCGKTTLSLGLMRLLSDMGLKVQPFKCGPDYIDTQFHTLAAGMESVNLDTFMSSSQHVRQLFNHYSNGMDVAVIEGVMGMFDGYNGMSGSSAEIALKLSLPVILLVNAESTAYSVAPIIYGFKNFCHDIHLAGVIFNRVSSAAHYELLSSACRGAGVECLGYLRRNSELSTPSRHLGLTIDSKQNMECFISAAAKEVASSINIKRLLELTEVPECKVNCYKAQNPKPTLKAAVAYDEAFNFIYRANIDKLKADGYEIIFFSPIHDHRLPEADFIYIPGGYPELFAEQISSNTSMLREIKNYVECGGRMWAECGGLIYLSRCIDNTPMCGIFPLHCTMIDSRLTLGYRDIQLNDLTYRGHEFHYSRITNPDAVKSVATQINASGAAVATPLYRYKNVYASYTHIYWAEGNSITKLPHAPLQEDT